MGDASNMALSARDQHISRNRRVNYAFGSSTPRDFSYLNHVPYRFRVYDSKLRSRAAQRGAATLRDYMREAARSVSRQRPRDRSLDSSMSHGVFVFGSSTPRELSHMEHVSRACRVYNARMNPMEKRSQTTTFGAAGSEFDKRYVVRRTSSMDSGDRSKSAKPPFSQRMVQSAITRSKSQTKTTHKKNPKVPPTSLSSVAANGSITDQPDHSMDVGSTPMPLTNGNVQNSFLERNGNADMENKANEEAVIDGDRNSDVEEETLVTEVKLKPAEALLLEEQKHTESDNRKKAVEESSEILGNNIESGIENEIVTVDHTIIHNEITTDATTEEGIAAAEDDSLITTEVVGNIVLQEERHTARDADQKGQETEYPIAAADDQLHAEETGEQKTGVQKSDPQVENENYGNTDSNDEFRQKVENIIEGPVIVSQTMALPGSVEDTNIILASDEENTGESKLDLISEEGIQNMPERQLTSTEPKTHLEKPDEINTTNSDEDNEIISKNVQEETHSVKDSDDEHSRSETEHSDHEDEINEHDSNDEQTQSPEHAQNHNNDEGPGDADIDLKETETSPAVEDVANSTKFVGEEYGSHKSTKGEENKLESDNEETEDNEDTEIENVRKSSLGSGQSYSEVEVAKEEFVESATKELEMQSHHEKLFQEEHQLEPSDHNKIDEETEPEGINIGQHEEATVGDMINEDVTEDNKTCASPALGLNEIDTTLTLEKDSLLISAQDELAEDKKPRSPGSTHSSRKSSSASASSKSSRSNSQSPSASPVPKAIAEL